MRIGYFASVPFRQNSPSGGFAHMRQFLTQAAKMGHELILMHGGDHPHPSIISPPKTRLGRFLALRQVDFLYYRVEYKTPNDAKWMLAPRNSLIGSPPTAWEFNTVPEYARTLGEDDAAIEKHIAGLVHYGAACDLACCVSPAITAYVNEKVGLRNVITVQNGSDPELFTPDAIPVKHVLRHPNRLNVVWMGSAEVKWHNFEMLKDAAWLLWDNGNPCVDFHIIGNGMQGLRDLPPNVHYHGSEQYEKLPNWLTAMDVGLNVYKSGPADYSCPLKLFDYMACGLTLVSTDQPQAREIFQELGQLDLIIPPGNAQALADALRKLSADRERVKRQGAAARQRAVSFYNWRRATKDTLDAMERILAERRNEGNGAEIATVARRGTGVSPVSDGNPSR
ncbi:MAG TPA: glycosyltransferase [Tepidisphaeraceae bacterium]|jgi:glycosyltransferase involved in cell wall biosynthesis|nr:glycosyltransferase [Tepidisphaeraceae bacterium]